MPSSPLTVSPRSAAARVWKTLSAALLAALIMVPNVQAQADPPPASRAWEVVREHARFYSMSFEGGHLSDLKRLWTNAFPSDNFLINFPEKSVDLPAFQLRDMTLPELARSIAFLSQGAFAIEVVEQKDGLPGNIWRISRPSRDALSDSLKMRAVSAPRLFANERTLERFLGDVDLVRKQMFEALYALKRDGSSMPLIGTEIMPLSGQRVFVLIGTEAGVSGLESLIKAAEQAAAEPAGEGKSGK